MKREVLRTFPLGNGRFGIERMKKFLWIELWNRIPDIYVDYDMLVMEEKKLKAHLQHVTKAKNDEDKHIKSQIESANRSYQGYSRSMPAKKRAKTRVDTIMLDEMFSSDDETTGHNRKRGSPSQYSCGPADIKPNNGGNQKSNKQIRREEAQRNNQQD